jgi:hypothetical protein
MNIPKHLEWRSQDPGEKQNEKEMSPPRATISSSAPKGNANFYPETTLGSSTRGVLKRERRKNNSPTFRYL